MFMFRGADRMHLNSIGINKKWRIIKRNTVKNELNRSSFYYALLSVSVRIKICLCRARAAGEDKNESCAIRASIPRV